MFIPSLCAVQVVHLILVPIKGSVKVDGSSLKCRKDTCVFNRVGSGTLLIWKDILKDPPSCLLLSSPRFHVENHATMSRQPVVPWNIIQVLVHIYRRAYQLYTSTSHSALGVGKTSDQGLAHSTEQPGIFPPHLVSREKIFLLIVTLESFSHLFRHNDCVFCYVLLSQAPQHSLPVTQSPCALATLPSIAVVGLCGLCDLCTLIVNAVFMVTTTASSHTTTTLHVCY